MADDIMNRLSAKSYHALDPVSSVSSLHSLAGGDDLVSQESSFTSSALSDVTC